MYGDVFEYAKIGPVTRTVSVCFRHAIVEPYLRYIGIGNDLVLQTILAKNSLFAKYQRSMTMYRQGGVSTDRMNYEKKVLYIDWYIKNRLLQKELFPEDCNWNEEELSDLGIYVRMRQAISTNDWHRALRVKKMLKTPLYRRKKYAKYLNGPISCWALSKFLCFNEK